MLAFCAAKSNFLKHGRNVKQAKICPNCKTSFTTKHKVVFCSTACRKAIKFMDSVNSWKRGELLGWHGKTFKVASWLRRYLFIKYENKCCKCGWDKQNLITGKIPLEVNHIDGNAANCAEENLELLCPNCHSLTPNFRNLNRKSVRAR